MLARITAYFAAVIAALILLYFALLTGYRSLHAGRDVAFLGDSITERWRYPAVDFGVFGNTTQQMLDRFNSLIPGHGYKIVVILGGTNDVLQGIDPSITIHNLEEIGERTTEQHAEPILCEIPPIFHTSNPADRKNYDPHVRELNIRIAQLAATHHWKQVDYYSPLVNRPSFSNDGVHMTRGGYLVMEWTLLHQIPVF